MTTPYSMIYGARAALYGNGSSSYDMVQGGNNSPAPERYGRHWQYQGSGIEKIADYASKKSGMNCPRCGFGMTEGYTPSLANNVYNPLITPDIVMPTSVSGVSIGSKSGGYGGIGSAGASSGSGASAGSGGSGAGGK